MPRSTAMSRPMNDMLFPMSGWPSRVASAVDRAAQAAAVEEPPGSGYDVVIVSAATAPRPDGTRAVPASKFGEEDRRSRGRPTRASPTRGPGSPVRQREVAADRARRPRPGRRWPRSGPGPRSTAWSPSSTSATSGPDGDELAQRRVEVALDVLGVVLVGGLAVDACAGPWRRSSGPCARTGRAPRRPGRDGRRRA